MNRETNILWTEITDFPKGWGIKNHAHKSYYHLFYFVKGKSIFWINDKKFDVVPGICFLMPPGTFHGLEAPTEEDLQAYEIKFEISDPYLLKHLTEEIILVDEGDFIKTCVEFVQRNGLSHTPEKQSRVNHFLCALLLHLAGNNADPHQKNSELIDTSNYSPAVIDIISYVETNYMHHLYLDEIAQHVEYNRNYMCLLFKKDTGITVVDYLNYVRIRKACEYILYSDISFSQICYRVGFVSLSHFNRTFKKLVGTTPSAYSKMVAFDDNNLVPKNVNGTTSTPSLFPPLEKALAALKVGNE